jgi:outer membrane cobalamin receptor
MKKRYRNFAAFLLLLFVSTPMFSQDSLLIYRSSVRDVLEVPRSESLADALNLQVITASNTSEKIADAPAQMLVLTREQLIKRGYRSLLDFLKDLPGVDLSIAHGDTYFKAYFRGYRNTIGDAFLFMIDGVIFNDLYFNQTRSVIAMPLSFVEQIEIVYGPASSVYGPNATMGVINVITKKGQDVSHANSLSGFASMTGAGYGIADLQYLYRKNRFGISVTGRFQSGNLNQVVNPEDFYWTQKKWHSDSKLWGDFVNNENTAGSFSSPEKSKALDVRMFTDKIEIGAQYYQGKTGFGTTYPADRITPLSIWDLPEKSIFARYSAALGRKLSSRTFVRYRTSEVANGSADLQGYNVTNGKAEPVRYGNTLLMPGESMRILAYSFWQTFNESVSFYQDFDYNFSEKITFRAGFKYEDKNLQKAYDIMSGDLYFPDSLKKASLAYPERIPFLQRPYNRINWRDLGGYVQAKIRINELNILHLGLRNDNNSSYGDTFTLRAGYIRKLGKANLKFFYGEAFQEPVPRLLYGGWRGSGSDPTLLPERSRTAEINFNLIKGKISQNVNLYAIQNYNTIVNFTGGAQNLGERNVAGLDYELRAFLPWRKTEITFYYSAILYQSEKKFNANKEFLGTGIIGDLATHKFFLIVNSEISSKINVNLRARFISEKKTVASNPLGRVPGYFVSDINVLYTNFLVKGLNLSLGCSNLLNTVYFTPGVRDAGSGNTGGTWEGRRWNGSKSWYNSWLPQPRREIWLSLIFNL